MSPIRVVVSVDPWADIVQHLGGRCAVVTTVISGGAADPHSYEPTPADNATFASAQLIVINGLDYDAWAVRAIDALSTRPAVIDGAEVVGAKPGDNPHLWYSPDHVDAMATAVGGALSRLVQGAATYLEDRARAWQNDMTPYRDQIATIKRLAEGKTFAATESVFDYMAAAVGLQNLTPSGYQSAAANESDPAPGDINDFDRALEEKRIDVLFFNTQTEGSLPEEIRDTAIGARVAVVSVTETVPPEATSFLQWQVGQLQALERALT